MGNNNNSNGISWFSAVKKAFKSPPSGVVEGNGKKPEEKKRGNWRWLYRKHYYLETTIQQNVANLACKPCKVHRVESEERSAIAVAMATTAAAEAAVKTAQAAVEVMRLSRKSVLKREHRAAVVVQRFFRGYLARKALQALKGVVKLQALIRGYNVRKRAKMTLQCIQSLVRVQAHVCNQRRRLSYESTTSCSVLSPSGITARRKSTLKNANATRVCPISMKTPERKEDHYEAEEESKSTDTKKIRASYRRHSFALPGNEHFLDLNYKSHLHFTVNSLKTPSSCKIKPIQMRSCSPRCQKEEHCQQPAETPTSCLFYSPRTSFSEGSLVFSRPNYMAATASANARAKSNGAPGFNFSSPGREPMGSAKKRLVFTASNLDKVD